MCCGNKAKQTIIVLNLIISSHMHCLFTRSESGHIMSCKFHDSATTAKPCWSCDDYNKLNPCFHVVNKLPGTEEKEHKLPWGLRRLVCVHCFRIVWKKRDSVPAQEFGRGRCEPLVRPVLVYICITLRTVVHKNKTHSNGYSICPQLCPWQRLGLVRGHF